MSRFKLPLLLTCIAMISIAACTSEQSPTQPELTPMGSTEYFATPTPQDETFLPHLKAGTFTICKVIVGGGTETFDFTTEAVGTGVASAPIYEPLVTLGDGECADVYEAPHQPGSDQVTITEQLPAGWAVDRVAIWNIEEQPDGSFLTTFHEYPAGTTQIQGAIIDGGKIGCVAVFYNSTERDTGECTRTPGYWKTHPDAWPVEEITIGGTTYSKVEALSLLWLPERGDKSKTLFRSLVAAKLNQLNGTNTSCVGATMLAADAWMAANPVCSNVRGGGPNSPWRDGEPLYLELDDYNNGRLECADHCP